MRTWHKDDRVKLALLCVAGWLFVAGRCGAQTAPVRPTAVTADGWSVEEVARGRRGQNCFWPPAVNHAGTFAVMAFSEMSVAEWFRGSTGKRYAGDDVYLFDAQTGQCRKVLTLPQNVLLTGFCADSGGNIYGQWSGAGGTPGPEGTVGSQVVRITPDGRLEHLCQTIGKHVRLTSLGLAADGTIVVHELQQGNWRRSPDGNVQQLPNDRHKVFIAYGIADDGSVYLGNADAAWRLRNNEIETLFTRPKEFGSVHSNIGGGFPAFNNRGDVVCLSLVAPYGGARENRKVMRLYDAGTKDVQEIAPPNGQQYMVATPSIDGAGNILSLTDAGLCWRENSTGRTTLLLHKIEPLGEDTVIATWCGMRAMDESGVIYVGVTYRNLSPAVLRIRKLAERVGDATRGVPSVASLQVGLPGTAVLEK